MAILHNQTDPDLIREGDEKTSGLGLFLFGDISFERGPEPGFRVRSVEKISFFDCHFLATFAIAFKWIPYFRLDDPAIALAEKEPCSGLCVTRCVRIPCWCINGVCRRIDPV
jgi:hypothetical protein